MGEGKGLHPDNLALNTLVDALEVLRNCKPGERGELARRYSVAITELEKVVAYVDTFILQREYWPCEELPANG